AADAAADAEKPAGDARDSAPSLPPPPRAPVKLPGVAQGAESVAAKFAAPNVFNAGRPPSATPDTWAGGSSTIAKPSLLKRLLASPKRMAIAAGGLVVIVAVIVFATGGSSKPSPNESSGKPTPSKAQQLDPSKPGASDPTVAPAIDPTTALPSDPS